MQAVASIESRSSWIVASVALVTLLMAFGGAWITPVALKDIAAEVGGAREVPALVSALGPPWPLWIGHGAFIGFIGLGGINAPMYIYISRWFDRRRGSALALISSGSYPAGAMWPPIFERVISSLGWRDTMLIYAAVEIAVIVPLAAVYFRAPPEVIHPAAAAQAASRSAAVLGWPPNLVF